MIGSYKITGSIYSEKATHYAKNASFIFDKFLDKYISKLSVKEVIDIGCGPGQDTDYFNRMHIKAIGVDSCLEMIEIAKKNYPWKFELFDVISSNYFKNKKIQNVWLSAVLMHFKRKDLEIFLKDLSSALVKKGIVGIIIPEKMKNDWRRSGWEKLGAIFNPFSVEEISFFLKKADLKIDCVHKFKYMKSDWLFIIAKK